MHTGVHRSVYLYIIANVEGKDIQEGGEWYYHLRCFHNHHHPRWYLQTPLKASTSLCAGKGLQCISGG